MYPEKPGVTRAKLLSGGWVLVPKGRVTLVSYFVQVDLRGSIPATVTNVISVKQPLCIHYVRKAMEEEDHDHVSVASSSL